MLGTAGYYTLVASLPVLARFDRVPRLPINRERLDARLRMLSAEHAAIVTQVQDFLHWQRQPMERTGAAVLASYRTLMATVSQPSVHGMVEYRMMLRTLMAGLRARHAGHSRPLGPGFGIGPWSEYIARNWELPDFGLRFVQPWIGKARELLEAGDSVALERYLMGLGWTHLERLQEGHYFDFDAVLVYLFKWDLVERWQRWSRELAVSRFRRLSEEGLAGHARLFA